MPLTIRLVLTLSVFLVLTPNARAVSSDCENLFLMASETTDTLEPSRLEIATARATDGIVEILRNGQNSQQWIVVDLVQDMSFLPKNPRVPGFLLTWIARSPFNEKVEKRLEEGRSKDERPKLLKMYFSNKPETFRGMDATRVSHSIVRLQARDLPVLVNWFVESVYHPVLGNKVFKIQDVQR